MIKITHANYPGFRIELWGGNIVNGKLITSDSHENLNGKHLKDRMGSNRTLVFPDGAKITLIADGYDGPLLSITIFDGKEVHRINTACGALEYCTANSSFAQALDEREADSEAAGIEFTTSGLLFFNQYMEDVPGNKVFNREPLGEIFHDQPTQVNDYYDDPRLQAT